MVNSNGSAAALRFLRCMIAEETYCLSMTHVRGIRRLEELQGQETVVARMAQTPGASPGACASTACGHGSAVLGWLPGSAGAIPVFRLAALLKRTEQAADPVGKILVLHTSPLPFGVAVDHVEDIFQVSAQEVLPLPPLLRSPQTAWFEGVVRLGSTWLLALSPAGLHPQAGASDRLPVSTTCTLESLYAAVGSHAAARARGKMMLFTTTSAHAVTFGLSLAQVPQVLQAQPLLPVHGTAPYILGLINWRNVPLAVIDLSRRLGGPAAPLTPDGRLLVVRAAKSRVFVGLAIQPQISIRALPLAHRVSTRRLPWSTSLLRGSFELDHTLLLIPDVDRLVDATQGPPLPAQTSQNQETGHCPEADDTF